MTKADFYSEQQSNHRGFHSLGFPGMCGECACVRACKHVQACLHVSVNVCAVRCDGGVIGNIEERVQIPCFSTLPAPTEKGKSDTLSQFANRSVRWGRGVHLMGQLTWTNRVPICVSTRTPLDGGDGVWMKRGEHWRKNWGGGWGNFESKQGVNILKRRDVADKWRKQTRGRWRFQKKYTTGDLTKFQFSSRSKQIP